jgi:hypothetical protein
MQYLATVSVTIIVALIVLAIRLPGGFVSSIPEENHVSWSARRSDVDVKKGNQSISASQDAEEEPKGSYPIGSFR